MNDYEKQARDFMKKYGWSFTRTCIGGERPDWDKEHTHSVYKFTFRKRKGDGKSRTMSGKFYASLFEPNKCEAYDVLACLTKDDPGDLDEFIKEYGIVINSEESYKTAVKTWKACKKEYNNLLNLTDTADEWEALQEIC